jgi:hypothetical protein
MRSGAGKAFARSAKQARPKMRRMRDMLIDEPGGYRYVTHEKTLGRGAVLYLCFRLMIAYAAFALVTADQCYTRTCMQDELGMQRFVHTARNHSKKGAILIRHSRGSSHSGTMAAARGCRYPCTTCMNSCRLSARLMIGGLRLTSQLGKRPLACSRK